MHRPKIFAVALALALLLPLAAFAQPDTGTANFTRYVALGDSLTSGFMSGGLARTGEANSYPVLIYRQATGGGTGFVQPIISDPGIPAQIELKSLSPLTLGPKSGAGTLTNPQTNPVRPFSNLGVPGAKVRDTLLTFSGGLHDAILQQFIPPFQGLTALQQAVLQNPTFVTLWIGNNDVLAAATTGRVIEGVTLTPVAQFETDYRAIANTVAATGAKMAIANIPDVTTIPFVNTLSRFLINPATNQPVLVNGQPVPLLGPDGPVGPNDRVLLSATTELAAGRGIPAPLGPGIPLSDSSVLNATELATISARVQAYNNIIRAVATEKNAAFVDSQALLINAAAGRVGVGGVQLTPAFLTGGIFSYDGVHPNEVGYALLANEFIKAINSQFNAKIPQVNLLPFLFGPSTTGSNVAGIRGVTGGATMTEAGVPAILTKEAMDNLFWALRIDPNAKKPTVRRPRGRH